MSLARRAFLRTSGAALLTLAAPKLVLAADAPKLRRLKLHNIHTGEKLAADYCIDGCYEPQALAAITNPTVNSYKCINAWPTLLGVTWVMNTANYTGKKRKNMMWRPEEGR